MGSLVRIFAPAVGVMFYSKGGLPLVSCVSGVLMAALLTASVISDGSSSRQPGAQGRAAAAA